MVSPEKRGGSPTEGMGGPSGARREVRWESAVPTWGDKTYPVRPSDQEVRIYSEHFRQLGHRKEHAGGEGVVVLLGSTPELRSALASLNNEHLRVLAAERYEKSFDAMTKLMASELARRERESGKFQLVLTKWQELPLKKESADLVVGDLVLNIVFKDEKGIDTTSQEHIQEQRLVLDGIKKSLKDGGKAILRTWVVPPEMRQSDTYRDIDDVFYEWEKFKAARNLQLDLNDPKYRKEVFGFFANRLIRHYQDDSGKFVCRDMADRIERGMDRDGRQVEFPDGVNEVMSWQWKDYTIPNWVLPQEDQENIMRERFKIERLTTADDLSDMNPMYVLSK